MVEFGLQAPAVKTHGSSDAKAVYSNIRQIRPCYTCCFKISVLNCREGRVRMSKQNEILATIEKFLKDRKGPDFGILGI